MTGCTDTFTLSLYKWRLQMLLNERGNWEFKSLLDFFPVSVFPGVVLYCEMQVCFGAREIERREKAMWISAPSHKRTSLLSALVSIANPLIFHRFSTAHAVPAKSSLFQSFSLSTRVATKVAWDFLHSPHTLPKFVVSNISNQVILVHVQQRCRDIVVLWAAVQICG